ncbi:hypothetical protein [Burkholderia contaminans]|uniref:hypothetical protein n=1 Tax=Burkholderia contaminans TaxID=488447 RepID=UPI000A51CFE5|nr:hypothetical protein [Burkholderia contaminans]MEB4636807.1 hypothetical protein [Burkholderia contaminans]MEB4651650.1 hypothetical protein [Burkholderia contaminans]MEB4661221.1 hypothetical protein [Burkholderia contaminans]MEB4667169.1 hypothetical protein [Burkholderia contaminans]MEB4678451.1 hypothetical protein [Burkholderia contaminans]
MLAVKRHLAPRAMKQFHVRILLVVLGGAASSCLAGLPPKYLSVEKFDKCLADKQVNTSRAWCLPEKKPDTCPGSSWDQLRQLKGRDKIPRCA